MRPNLLLAALLLSTTHAFAQADAREAPTGSPQPASEAATSPDDYVELIKRVQLTLHLHGFDPGPVNGLDEGRTQAALAQFQLSRSLPASGSVDEQTLKALGVGRDILAAEEENASAGAGMPLARP